MQKIIPAERNRFMAPMPIQVCMRHLASQENCDGEEWDLLQEASFYIDELELRVAEMETALKVALGRLKCVSDDSESLGFINSCKPVIAQINSVLEANRALDEATTTRLSREDQARFVELLLNPPAPNAALIKARLGIK